jgi:hypothetical protein
VNVDDTLRELAESSPRHMVLFVNAVGAAPVGYPMTAFFVDGRLCFNTYRKARKVERLLADDRVTCLFSPPSTEPVPERAIVVRGRARPTDAGTAHDAVQTGRHGRVTAPLAIREKVADRVASGKRIVFAVDVEDVSETVPPTGEATCRVRI